MRSWPVVAISALMLGTTPARGAPGCGKMSVMSVTEETGQTIELILDSAAIEKAPTWSPGAGNPPLPVSRAVEIANAWAKSRYARFDSVEIREISLKSLGCSSPKGWYYVFDFVPVIDGNRAYGSGNWAAVLMDGTVVGATRAGAAENAGG
jgi:hypothetical protein